MPRPIMPAAVLPLLLAMSSSLNAQPPAPPAREASSGVVVHQPWARASAGQAANGAAYMTLEDNRADNRLLSASSPIAATVELHEVVHDAGVMRMRAIPEIPFGPGKPARLAPGGLHIMFLGLKQPLRQGESVPLTLRFAEGPEMTIQVPVQAPAAMGAGAPARQ